MSRSLRSEYAAHQALTATATREDWRAILAKRHARRAEYPLQASMHDLGLLALLGVVQLAIPCLLLVRLSRVLSAPEIALLGLLEVVFGVTWTWLWAGEQPSTATLSGGALVLGALVTNELLALRSRQRIKKSA